MPPPSPSPPTASLITDFAGLQRAFTWIKAASRLDMAPSLAHRQQRLDALEALLRDNMKALCAAVSADFGHRSSHETQLLEIFPSLEGIRHTRRHLGTWMKPQRRSVSLWFQPARAELRPQALGCVGIISPWNYPVYLAIGPLTAALAAGNRALVKMSEFTPSTAALFAELALRYFPANELAVVGGDHDLAQAFSHLPFDHLLFTGSTAVGRLVMKAAAENLTPVTLELGGKSPAIIAPDYPTAKAAERILAGKCLNAGQTCIAPDYLFLPDGEVENFIAAARKVVAASYPDLQQNPDYSAVINTRHAARLQGYLEDAATQGAHIVPLVPLAEVNPNPNGPQRLAPTLILQTTESMKVMQEEIFGPLLPILTYRNMQEALDYINAHDRPLALYLFDRDKARINQVLDQTIAGGVTVNDTILHIAQDDLPFGGVGPSGMGQYHGHEGFRTFSKLKPVFYQSRLNGIGLFNPPYGKLFERLLKLLLR